MSIWQGKTTGYSPTEQTDSIPLFHVSSRKKKRRDIDIGGDNSTSYDETHDAGVALNYLDLDDKSSPIEEHFSGKLSYPDLDHENLEGRVEEPLMTGGRDMEESNRRIGLESPHPPSIRSVPVPRGNQTGQ
jgi:hypothetical protein